MAASGRPTFNGQVRIKNSEIINSEISAYVFYINSGVFSACYGLNFTKYSNMFKSNNIKQILRSNPIKYPFQFVAYHEMAHLRRAHGDIDNNLISATQVVQATEFDADLLAAAALYHHLEPICQDSDDSEIRCLTILFIIEILCAMNTQSGGGAYQSMEERLWHILIKMSHLNKPQDSGLAVDVDCTSDATKRYFSFIQEFILQLKRPPIQDVRIAGFIDSFVKYRTSNRPSSIISNWSKIKNKVAEASNTSA